MFGTGEGDGGGKGGGEGDVPIFGAPTHIVGEVERVYQSWLDDQRLCYSSLMRWGRGRG